MLDGLKFGLDIFQNSQVFVCVHNQTKVITADFMLKECSYECKKHIFNYLLTPWCRVLLVKVTGLQLVKKFSQFHGTRRFFNALTSVRHLSLSWAHPIQSIYPHPTSRRSILILYTHLRLGLPSGLFPSGFSTKNLYTNLSTPIRATCPAHLIFLDFITPKYWVKSTDHLAPCYAISSIPHLPRLS